MEKKVNENLKHDAWPQDAYGMRIVSVVYMTQLEATPEQKCVS